MSLDSKSQKLWVLLAGVGAAVDARLFTAVLKMTGVMEQKAAVELIVEM